MVRIANMPGIGLPIVSHSVTASRSFSRVVTDATAEVWTAVMSGQVDIGIAKDIDCTNLEFQPLATLQSAQCRRSILWQRSIVSERRRSTGGAPFGLRYAYISDGVTSIACLPIGRRRIEMA